MTKISLPFVQALTDRHGHRRHYFRRAGFARVTLPGAPGEPEFMAAYQAAFAGESVRPQIGSSRSTPGSVNALVAAYLGSAPFKALAASSQEKYRRLLDGFRGRFGSYPVAPLNRGNVQRLVNERANTPFEQRSFLKALRVMFAWALVEGKVADNPTMGIKVTKARTSGHRTWSEEDIARFEAHHPIGTQARLAFALLLYTGQRRSDVVRMGQQHIKDDVLRITQQKTGAEVAIPVHGLLVEVLANSKLGCSGERTFLETKFGAPYDPDGFTHFFRRTCDAAGCKGLSAHGLRKAAARRLAEAGCSTWEIASITGHATLAEVERYSRAAERGRLARSAMAKLGTKSEQIVNPVV